MNDDFMNREDSFLSSDYLLNEYGEIKTMQCKVCDKDVAVNVNYDIKSVTCNECYWKQYSISPFKNRRTD